MALWSDAGRAAPPEFSQAFPLDAPWERVWNLSAGDAIAISIGVQQPSRLPPNARIEVTWKGPEDAVPRYPADRGDQAVSATSDWAKVLHALDPDLHLTYRAPAAGEYVLRLAALENRPQPLGELPHDTGQAPRATPLPTRTPAATGAGVSVSLTPVAALQSSGLVLEAEPNNAPEQATPLVFPTRGSEQEVRVIGGSDDLEYFNATRLGRQPDDWYRFTYEGDGPAFVSANLQLVEPVVSARIRFYKEGTPSEEELQERDIPNSYDFANFNPIPYVHPPATLIDGPVPVYTYEEGRALNERAHQQDRTYRTFVVRQVFPGDTYFLRVEANQPHYELHVRLFDPAPYDDPVTAVRQGVYYHLAEIDAWLIHRPRNIAPHRRLRDATALFGENCMSCHTQSGVWGVADAFRNGYRPDGVEQNYRRLVNTMYESLRLTNQLKEAAVNTSVAPNDLGDGPAGTRVAGRNIVLHERSRRPKRLHAQWQRRTANYVLQTADPKGINAAGRGSNFGPNVVFKFAGEVLDRAWRDTGEPRYFFGLEQKGRRILATGDAVRVTDDYGHRVEFVHRIWPSDYVEQVRRLTASPRRTAAAERLDRELRSRADLDLQRLLALQQDDGGWGFHPGRAGEDGAWQRPEDHSYPAATAVALIALEAAGRGAGDPVVDRGVRWLLRNQYPYGLWNAAAATGFVTSAYAIRALSRLHPDASAEGAGEYRLEPDAPMLEALRAVRDAQATGDARHAELFVAAAGSPHPQIRLYGLLGLGGALAGSGVPVLIDHLDDPVKSCREAAFWSLRQLLLDGQGWSQLLDAYRVGSDRARQSVMQALVTRAHVSWSGSGVDLARLTGVLTAGMVDPHPGVRAFAFKAAWHWWVWNPPLREPINQAWMDALLREEPEAQVEAALRYSTISLFIVNGQVNNITGGKYLDQQYAELAALFGALSEWREQAPAEGLRRLDRRLTAMAASHYMERANQQSPGQFAYSTPGATELFGKAVLAVYGDPSEDDVPWRSIALEGARNITYKPLQDAMLELLRSSDPQTVAVAARALSNPSELALPARREALAPLLHMLRLYARQGRSRDADAVANFLARVRWDFEGVSAAEETEFYRTLLDRRGPDSASAPGGGGRHLAAKPAPASDQGGDGGPHVALIARILGENRTLHRREAFRHLSGEPRLWLDSTEWMLAFREGGASLEEAVEGAWEAEDLEIDRLDFGRTTEQMIPGGVASGNSALIWEEGKVGARISFAMDVPDAGRYELLGAFLYGASHGIVEMRLAGQPVLEQMDFFRREVTSTGPMPLGVFDLRKGRVLFTVEMLGTNPDAEPEYKFGLDYLKLAPRSGQPLLTKDSHGVDRIDPVQAAKSEVVALFVLWFSADVDQETRDLASRLASSPSLRGNPEVRKAISAYVESEPVGKIRSRLMNILANDDEKYGQQLRDLIAKAPQAGGSSDRPIAATDAFIRDILQFRDHVLAELSKPSERDGKACIACHGVPGRVPTLYLNPPDGAGHIGAADLLENYRKLQARVNLNDPERSLLLRKPLNVQTGEEEGHQGGMRYEAGEPGHEILRKWVIRQAELQAGGG